MLRSLLLVLVPAYTASAAVANVCAIPPYISMLDFVDWEPAMAYCAPHYPAQTVTKQLPERCLTETSTVILGTSVVTTSSSEACPTSDHLQRRADGEGGRRDKICQRWKRRVLQWEEEKPHSPEQVRKWRERVAWHRKKYPWCHASHLQVLHDLPESTYPMPTEHAKAKRDAGPAPAAKVKRDAMATKSLQWREYAAELVNCGYECIQTVRAQAFLMSKTCANRCALQNLGLLVRCRHEGCPENTCADLHDDDNQVDCRPCDYYCSSFTDWVRRAWRPPKELNTLSP